MNRSCDPNGVVNTYVNSAGETFRGLTKREYFALHLMSAGIIADPGNAVDLALQARVAIKAADALVSALQAAG